MTISRWPESRALRLADTHPTESPRPTSSVAPGCAKYVSHVANQKIPTWRFLTNIDFGTSTFDQRPLAAIDGVFSGGNLIRRPALLSPSKKIIMARHDALGNA